MRSLRSGCQADVVGRFGVPLETIRYRNNCTGNGSNVGAWYGACDNDCILMGAYGYTNRMGARGNIDIANISYKIPGSLGLFSNFVVYNDWSRLGKSTAGYPDSYGSVIGPTANGTANSARQMRSSASLDAVV